MPNYDYRCEECKQDFTVERSMSDNSVQNCLSCGSEKANRIWSVFLMIGGSTPDYGQGTFSSSSSGSTTTTEKKSACGSCVSRACGTCH